MNKSSRIFILASILTFTIPGASLLAEEAIYGSQLMTQQERIEHRAKMQSMKTMEERNRYMIEHHKKMQERAKERGVTLPDAPMMNNKGMGSGHGKCGGGGMGGGGMGR